MSKTIKDFCNIWFWDENGACINNADPDDVHHFSVRVIDGSTYDFDNKYKLEEFMSALQKAFDAGKKEKARQLKELLGI